MENERVTFRTDGNFAIHVPDLAKARVFYSDVLGFRLVSSTEDQLEFDTGTVQLYVNKDAHTVPFIPALEVQNFQRAKNYLLEHGCEIVKEFGGHKALYFKDPFGITIDIIEKRPQS